MDLNPGLDDSVPADAMDKEQASRDSVQKQPISNKDTSEPGTDVSTLENELTNDKLVRLQAIFEHADEDGGGGLDMDEFRNAMRLTVGDHVTDEDLDMIFMKVDTNCDGTVDWEEYLTYMLLECREKDLMQLQAIQPFPRDFNVVEGEHKDSIVKILFLPNLKANLVKPENSDQRFYSLDANHGRFVSASKDGVVTFWCSELKTSIVKRVNPIAPQKSIWITDIAVLPRDNMMVLATTNRSLIFYDIGSNRFERLSIVTDMNACCTCVNFWCHPTSTCRSILVLGDDQGCLSVLRFNTCPSKTALKPSKNKHTSEKIKFKEFLQNKVKNVEGYYYSNVHGDEIRQVLYSNNMDCILSCSKDPTKSLYIGEVCRYGGGSYISVDQGINTFDHNHKMNIIVTGGYDRIIRVWNPYVTSKPVITLHGHKSPILNVSINPTREHVISISENREIRIYDMNTQTCIQTFFRKMIPHLGPKPISVAMFQTARQTLLFGTTVLAVLKHKVKEVKQLISHNKKVNVVLYNPLFNQVVSGSVDSLVCVWSAQSGEKVMQFKAHTVKRLGYTHNVEITAMTFDPTYRRLVTAARDGTAKVWNFNNGACLRVIPSPDDKEITSVVCPRDRIAIAGWNKRVSLFLDDPDDETFKILTPYNKQDILTLAYFPPSLVASGCHDGTILIWSLDTKRLVFYTRVGGSCEPQSCDVMEYLLGSHQSPRGRINSTDFNGDTIYNTQNAITQHPSVEKLLFLPKRSNNKDTATLFAACSDGKVRAYSVHHEGGLKGEFLATKFEGDDLTVMVTDASNDLLVTADSSGYIRVWDITHHYIAGGDCDIFNHADRLPFWQTFPYFGLKEMKRNPEDNTWYHPFHASNDTPHLINSFHAHLETIVSVDVANIHNNDMLVSCSTDGSIRMWTVTGQFIGIFGQPSFWCQTHKNVTDSLETKPRAKGTILPPDIRRVASLTTLRVIKGGTTPHWNLAKTILTWLGRLHIGNTVSHEPAAESHESSIIPRNVPDSEDQAKNNILGQTYKRQTQHRPLPTLERPPALSPHCSAYRSLPFTEIGSIKFEDMCDIQELTRIQKAYKLPSLRHDNKIYHAYKKVAWLVNTSGGAASRNESTKKDRSETDRKRKSSIKFKRRRMSLFHKEGDDESLQIDMDQVPSVSSSRRISLDDDVSRSRHVQSVFSGEMSKSSHATHNRSLNTIEEF